MSNNGEHSASVTVMITVVATIMDINEVKVNVSLTVKVIVMIRGSMDGWMARLGDICVNPPLLVCLNCLDTVVTA